LANAGRLEHEAERAEEFLARRKAIEAAMRRLELLSAERSLPADVVEPLRARHADRLKLVEQKSNDDETSRKLTVLYEDIEQVLLAAERDLINDLYRNGQLRDEPRRRIERELDLRDAYLANFRSKT